MATALRTTRGVSGRIAAVHHQARKPRISAQAHGRASLSANKFRNGLPRQLVVRAAAQPATATIATEAEAVKLEVAVPLRDARQALQLKLVKEGRGQAIEIAAVAPGSVAEQLGVRAGQRIRAMMDPVRPSEMLVLNDRPSLRFVLDVINMTLRDEVVMQLDSAYVDAADAAASVSLQSADDLAPASDSSTDGAVAVAATIAAQLEASYAALVAAGAIGSAAQQTIPLVRQQAAPPAPAPGQATVSNGRDGSMYVSLIQAQTQGQAANQDTSKMTDVQKRVKRRKDYLEQVSERNDTPFFAGVLAAFLLPAAVILAVAYSSGYLDRLYSNTLTSLV